MEEIPSRPRSRSLEPAVGTAIGVGGSERREATHKCVVSALRESEMKYRSLVENATEGVYQTSADGKMVAANPALVRMLGYESEEELRNVGESRSWQSQHE